MDNKVDSEVNDEVNGKVDDEVNAVASWKDNKKTVRDAVRERLNNKTPRVDAGGYAVYRRVLRDVVAESLIECPGVVAAPKILPRDVL